MLPGRALAGMGLAAGRAVAGAREAVDAKLKPFPLSGVRLRPGIFLDYLESNQGFLDSLPNDRLLHTFRLTAGIPTSADPLGGWEHPRGELRGHFALLAWSARRAGVLRSHANQALGQLMVLGELRDGLLRQRQLIGGGFLRVSQVKTIANEHWMVPGFPFQRFKRSYFGVSIRVGQNER